MQALANTTYGVSSITTVSPGVTGHPTASLWSGVGVGVRVGGQDVTGVPFDTRQKSVMVACVSLPSPQPASSATARAISSLHFAR